MVHKRLIITIDLAIESASQLLVYEAVSAIEERLLAATPKKWVMVDGVKIATVTRPPSILGQG